MSRTHLFLITLVVAASVIIAMPLRQAYTQPAGNVAGQVTVTDQAADQTAVEGSEEGAAAALGLTRPAGMTPTEYSQEIARAVQEHGLQGAGVQDTTHPLFSAGLRSIIDARAPFSTAIMTTVGGHGSQLDDVALLADWDGEEDFTADREGTVDTFATKITRSRSICIGGSNANAECTVDSECGGGSCTPTIRPEQSFTLTRAAISEHTIANGFTENVFYYGDDFGNVYVAQSSTLQPGAAGLSGANIVVINLPTVLNAFGSLISDDQIVITGLAVNPVADLTSFSNVNGSYTAFNGQKGEMLYVSFWDTGGGLRLNFGTGQIVRSGLLAFPIADVASGAPTFPVLSPSGFPVTVGGAFGVLFSVFSNVGGIAIDDDGSVYLHQADLIQFTGGNIVKLTDVGANQDRSLAVNGIATLTTLNPSGGNYGSTSGPAAQANRVTNYSGTSATFGNITALAAGPGNVLYAAVARSLAASDDAGTQDTEGLFTNPAALGDTPSMIISFSDVVGGFDNCTMLQPTPTVTPTSLPTSTFPAETATPTSTPAATVTATPPPVPPGILPVPDGFADVAQAGFALAPGVNNFRVFVLGTGPDPRGTNPAVFGTASTTQKVDFQVDYTVYGGLAVDEEGAVYVISGGTPAGVGTDPSPRLGEILHFPDHAPVDRRADYLDLRGNAFPNPPASGGNVGDGDADRFDYIFWQAPIDQLTATPAGIAGLARGFLLYLDRTRTNTAAFLNLPNGNPQGDDAADGPVYFNAFDGGSRCAGGPNAGFQGCTNASECPSSTCLDGQAAGGDDQNFPVRGDDAAGGFEFVFGADVAGTCTSPWTQFFLNANGSVSFSAGDTSNIPTAAAFESGPPKIAPAWADLNPGSRAGGFLNTFPVQALGFAGINHFKVRWIDVPEVGGETCRSTNTFAVSLFDDGTGVDESSPGVQEGPTDGRFFVDPSTGKPTAFPGTPPRGSGTGNFCFEYGRMDLLGTSTRPVLSGFAIGGQASGPAETDLSDEAGVADGDALRPGLIGDGTDPTVFELFDAGTDQVDIVTPAVPDFDLRFAGNDPALTTPAGQPNPNRGQLCLFGVDCDQCSVVLSPLTLPDPVFGASYSQTLQASGAVPPFTFVVSGGALPAGLVLSTGGVLTGPATALVTTSFSVTASAAVCSGSRTYALTVQPAPSPTPTVTPTSTPTPTVTPLPGFVPPNAVVATCGRKIENNIAKLARSIMRCHVAAAAAALDGISFDEETCETNARTRYTGITSRLAPTCPTCMTSKLATFADRVEVFLDGANGDLYCAGSTAFGGDDGGFVPPNAVAAKCAKKLAGAETTFATSVTNPRGTGIIKCHANAADFAFRVTGPSFSLASCETAARTKYDMAAGKLGTDCPACLLANATMIREQLEAFLDELDENVYCEGTRPIEFN